MSTHNKHAATEDQVGYLHMAVTKLFTKKADAILEVIEESPEAAIGLVSGKDLSAMCKWVLDNGITAVPAAQEGGSDLSKKLAKIKAASQGKVIQFAKEA
ncbi:terminase small subunit [Lelliottia phage phD2B]|uniref:Putative terminase small subunit n=1 Tax=Lelliottia phage phD2B TaxID=1542498 RepID=A0A088FSD0_9CAUD|nr:terminase small subunit [Lelliottia phage phD2B]AIM51266.1 putative terminase small subunit [Lelliottia phage phD2B]